MPDATGPSPAAPSRRRRYLTGLASAIVPGLGLVLLGRRRAGIALMFPVGALVLAGVVLLLSGNRTSLAATLVEPDVLTALLVFEAVVLAWRLGAVGWNLLAARPPRYGRSDVLPVLLLTAFVVLPQAYLGVLTSVARDTANAVFQVDEAGPVWRPSPTPLPPGETPTPVPSPGPTPVPRLTVLLIGEDSGVDRSTANTDSLIVASLDPVGRTVSMLSIPRDLVDAPIPGGGVWHPKINGLAAWVRWHPDQFPGSNGKGEAVLAAVIGELIGVQIDYWAKVNLPGLLQVVDAVGGVDVTVVRGFCDPHYREYGQDGFAIIPGRWHLNGSQALAYARVRHPLGESDFTRAARQQEVLVGLRDAVVRGGFLNDPIGFLQAIGRTVSTNVPPGILPQVATYAEEIGRKSVYRAVVTWPLVHPSAVPDPRGSIQIPDIPGIRALAAGLFPPPGTTPVVASGAADTGTAASPSPRPTGSANPAGATPAATGAASAAPAGRAPDLPRLVCRAPVVKPSPTPAPSGTPGPSASGSGEPGPSGSPLPSGSSEPVPTPAESPVVTPEPSPT